MKSKIFAALFLIFLGVCSRATDAAAGARIEFDLDRETAVIRAELRYFGDLRPEVLEKATQIIAKQWQGEPTREGDTLVTPLFLHFVKPLRVSTDIRAVYVRSIEKAFAQANKNRDVWVNYVRVEQSIAEKNSSEMPFGMNLARFIYDDRLDQSTTAAHEFGHGLDLFHIDDVQGWDGYPPIMLSRGQLPNRPEYAYEPQNPLSTVNPIYRPVRQEELNLISEKIQSPSEFLQGDSKKVFDTSLAKVVYEKGSRTRGYIDVGFWAKLEADEPFFMGTKTR